MSNRLKRFVVIAGVSAALFSCMTQSKVERWNNEHPKESAVYCMVKYPCVAGDSIILRDTVIKLAENQNYQATIDSLSRYIDRLNSEWGSIVQDTQNEKRDSTYMALYARYKEVGADLQRFKNAYKPCEPDTLRINVEKRIPYVDSAANVFYRERAIQAEERGKKLETELEHWKGLAKTRFWMLIGLSALVALFLVVFIRRKIS